MSDSNQEGKQSLFREKTLEALDSPEALNDYLKVTSPRVWLVLAAVIALLVGLILWSIIGQIDTQRQVAVVTDEEGTVCYVPFESFDALQTLLDHNRITIGGQDYTYRLSGDSGVECGFLHEFVDEKIISRVCIIGGLDTDTQVAELPVDASLEQGVQAGTVTVETLHPISLLLQ